MIHPALASLIDRYQPQSSNNYQNAVREIAQEIAVLGLWRTTFYDHAAFYDGSALWIFHGLQQFSEDLDFSLLRPMPDFSPKAYFGAVADKWQPGVSTSWQKESRKTTRHLSNQLL